MATTKGGLMAAKSNKPDGVRSMKDLVFSMGDQIQKALPTVITGERFTRMVLTAMSSNPQLQQCTPKSFLGAMMQAAQLGVEPNTPLGQAYLIPYKNKGTLECQFQLGYKGLIDLAYRSGEVRDIQAHEVYENDEFEYELGLEPKLRHVPAPSNRGSVIAYYAVFHTKDGGYGFEVMSTEDIKEHAKKYSQAYSSSYSPWSKNFDEMAKKTVLKRCLKYAPLKTEFVREMNADGTIKKDITANMADVPDETDYIDVTSDSVPDNVDPTTGEVMDTRTDQEKEDDAILAASM
ncbi:recombinase RecT [Anaeroglobus geminatus]|uniref:Recombination and repair protein RecT n=1 Tax=Anaeroglobus geminatus F0357 TaxID=861450 RepID=G9YK21_9FIRM|nr:recombinase RecT [Anaeroglobus geminatus]EHM37846.1 recombination and repair protein RecT [Anaeroglobus geminatus F0357]